MDGYRLLIYGALIFSVYLVIKPGRHFKRSVAVLSLFGWALIAVAMESYEAHTRASADSREQMRVQQPAAYAAMLREEAEQQALKRLPPADRQFRLLLDNPGSINEALAGVALIDQQSGPLKGRLVRITYFDPEPLSEALLLGSAIESYFEVAKIVADAEGADGVQFIVRSNATDQYGRSADQIAFILSIADAELRKIVWKNMTMPSLLKISDIDARSLGRAIVVRYCDDPAGALAAAFCIKARERS